MIFLRDCDQLDFAFLDTSDDLEHGWAEFLLAAMKGARMIVMDDFATKAKLAFESAPKEWERERMGRYTIFRLKQAGSQASANEGAHAVGA